MVVPPSSSTSLSSACTLFWLNQQGQFIVGNNQILAAYIRLIPTILKYSPPNYEEYTPSQLLSVIHNNNIANNDNNNNNNNDNNNQFPLPLYTQLQFIFQHFEANPLLYSGLPSISCKQLLATPPSPTISTPPLSSSPVIMPHLRPNPNPNLSPNPNPILSPFSLDVTGDNLSQSTANMTTSASNSRRDSPNIFQSLSPSH